MTFELVTILQVWADGFRRGKEGVGPGMCSALRPPKQPHGLPLGSSCLGADKAHFWAPGTAIPLPPLGLISLPLFSGLCL